MRIPRIKRSRLDHARPAASLWHIPLPPTSKRKNHSYPGNARHKTRMGIPAALLGHRRRLTTTQSPHRVDCSLDLTVGGNTRVVSVYTRQPLPRAPLSVISAFTACVAVSIIRWPPYRHLPFALQLRANGLCRPWSRFAAGAPGWSIVHARILAAAHSQGKSDVGAISRDFQIFMQYVAGRAQLLRADPARVYVPHPHHAQTALTNSLSIAAVLSSCKRLSAAA
ncbi:hypothetical protein DFH06DRAFT_1231648, partial [Mycena polygramma]